MPQARIFYFLLSYEPYMCPEPEKNPTPAEPKPAAQEKKGELPILDKYEDGELGQSNIPAWLRWGANPDRVSLAPKEEIESQHSQLAALTTSVARFVGGMFDIPNGYGVRFTRDGKKLICFLEPKK